MKSKLTLKCTCHRIHTNRFLMDPCKIHKHYYVKTSKKVKPKNKNNSTKRYKTSKQYKTLKHSLLKKKPPLRKITQSQKQTRKVSNTITNKKSKKKTKKVRFSIDLKKGTTDKKEVKEVKMNNTVELDNSVEVGNTVEVDNTVKETKKPKKHNVARGIEPEYDLKKVNIAKLKNKITIIKSCNEDDCQEIKNFINVNICDINTPINELMQFFTSLTKTDQQFIYNKIIRTHN